MEAGAYQVEQIPSGEIQRDLALMGVPQISGFGRDAVVRMR